MFSPTSWHHDRTRRAAAAMLCIGLSVFSGLYATQAMLPTLTAELGLSPTQAAATVTVTTGGLALCVVPASIISERLGRGRVVLWSTVVAAALGLAVPWADSAASLIGLRGVQGIVLAGAPAVAMAWLAEELDSAALPRAMGIYIAGNAVGGLLGRLIPTALLPWVHWQWAMTAAAVMTAFTALAAWVLLPAQQNFRPKAIHLRSELAALGHHLRTPSLRRLYLVAFGLMGVFVSIYNFLGFRLVEHFNLSPTLAGAVFILYLSGTWASARVGTAIVRWGRRRALIAAASLLCTGVIGLAGPLWLVLPAALALTVGFFAAHALASGWVGAIAQQDRAEASSLYVLSYYLGSSVVGTATGWLYGHVSWPWFIAAGAALSALVVVLAARMPAH